MIFKTFCFVTQLYGPNKSEINPDDRIWMILPETSEAYQHVKEQYEKCRENGAIMTTQQVYSDGSEWLLINCSSIDIAVLITNSVLGIEDDNRVICLGKYDPNDKEAMNKLASNLKSLIDMLDNEEEDNDERGSY